MATDAPPRPSRFPRLPWALLLALTAGIGLSLLFSFRFYIEKREEVRAQHVSTLETLADLKLAQVVNWRVGLRDNAAVLRDDPFIASALGQLLDSPRDSDTRELLRAWAKGQLATHGYQSVILVDGAGRVLLGTGDDSAALGFTGRVEVSAAVATGDVLLSDIHRRDDGSPLHLDVVVPLKPAKGNVARGAVFFRVDPSLTLFPLLDKWPTPSPSSEITLTRREGNLVVWLKPPRYAPPDAKPLSFSRPADSPGLLATRALAGEEGVVEGVDYRGVPVLGALRRMPDTDWALLAKVDLAEIDLVARRQAWRMARIGILIVLLAGALVLLARKRRDVISLQASERNYRALLDSAPLGVAIVRKRVVLWVNPAYQAMTGVGSGAAVEGRPLPAVIAPSQRKEVIEFALRWETGVPMPNQIETRVLHRDGSESPVLATLARITLADGPATAVFFRDLTGQKQTETETVRRQKLEAVTALTEGVAHDINNLLTAVIGNLSLARLLVGDPARLPGKLAEAEAASMQIKELVNRMAAQSRGNESHPLTLDVESLLREAARETATPLRPFAPVWTVAKGAWPVAAYPLRLRQALAVVMENAAEATAASPQAQPVEIAVDGLTLDGSPSGDGLAAGRYVRITICDHGPGIPAETLGRVFDPYFSTKHLPSDKGAGLGLHFAQSVIRHHRGSITLDSRPGGGTAVTILLPAAPPADASSGKPG